MSVLLPASVSLKLDEKDEKKNIVEEKKISKVIVLYKHALLDEDKKYFDKCLANYLSDNHTDVSLDSLMSKTEVLCIDINKYYQFYISQLEQAKKYIVVFLCRNGLPVNNIDEMKNKLYVSHIKKHLNPELNYGDILKDLLTPYIGKLKQSLDEKAAEGCLDCVESVKGFLRLK